MKPLIFLSGPFGTFMSGNAKLDITHRTLQVTIAAERSRLARKIQYLTEAVGLMYVHVIAWFDCKLRTELLVEILHPSRSKGTQTIVFSTTSVWP